MKKIFFKKILPLFLVLVMLLGGCTKKTTPDTSSGTDHSQTTVTEAPTGDASSKDAGFSDIDSSTVPGSSDETSGQTDNTSISSEDADSSDSTLFSYEKNADGTLTLTGYTGTETFVRIPSKIDDCAVTAIGASCFAGNIKAERISVPEGVTVIKDYAFECCSVLKKIYLPDSLTAIGDGVFSGCCSLYLVDIQDNVASIGKGAFLGCTALVSFVAPKGLNTAGAFAFANCTALVNADFHDSSLEAVSDRMFYACSSLATIRLPEGISSVGVRAFWQNEQIHYLYLPDTVKSIGAYAFESCSQLENFSVPCDVVEPYTFNCCSSLSYVSFPETLKKISVGAFKDTPINTEYLDIPEAAEVEEGAFGHLQGVYTDDSYYDPAPQEDVTTATAYDITADEITAQAEAAGFRTISRDNFRSWAAEYLDFNADNALLTNELNPYIGKYKGEIGYYFKAMTAVASGVESEIEAQKENFGEDFEDMYRMINHGLDTEMKRFRMKDDLLLYTGVYDFQLATAAGTDHIPTLDELKACIGKTFTDPCLTSTTTEAEVAFGFSDTLFVIYAPAKNLNALGSVCMDSYIFSVENEILLCSGATYEITDVGVMQATLTDEWSGEQHTECRNYVLLKLINE